MGFATSDFQKMFLKNYFKEILKNKEQFPQNHLEDISSILAKLHVKEFGVGNYPYGIISEHKSVENWIKNKIQEIEFVP